MEKMLKILGETSSEWVLCKDKLPGMPKSENKREEYLVYTEKGAYCVMGWCNGWNCHYNLDGTINRAAEIKDIIAWMEIPRIILGEDDGNEEQTM